MTHVGELAALATACCWVVTALAFERAGKRIGARQVNLLRLLAAVVLLSLQGWAMRGLPVPVDAPPRAWGWLALSGVVGLAMGDMCLFRAFVLIGARLSMLLMALVPPLTVVVGWVVLGETLGPVDLAGMVLTVAGVSWVILERSPDGERRRASPEGILLGLGGAVGQAAGLVLSKHGMGDFDAFASTWIRIAAASVVFVIAFTAMGWWPRVREALADRPSLGWTGLGAIFGPFLGVGLSLVSVQLTEAGVAATIMALTPVLIIPAAILLQGERVSSRAWAGAAVAVAGSGLLFL